MAPEMIAELLKLPPGERADLAMALWASLDEPHREAAVDLTTEMAAEFDQRLAAHITDPSTAIPWEAVRKKFTVGS